MASTQTYPKILHADQEHAGLRTAVFVLLFISFILAFFGIRALLTALSDAGTPDYAFVASCGGALPLALGLVWVVEKLMKQYWPSGRAVVLTQDGVQTKAEGAEPIKLDAANDVEPTAWHFDMRGWQRGGRERRLPRTWLCLAVELKAEKKQISVYTYMPSQQADSWLDAENGRIQFHKISPKDVYDNSIRSRMSGPSRPEIPAAVLTGADGKYWLAERRRWTEGFELPPKEFEQFMDHIQTTLEL
ncbi:MAG: hypothetical protein CL608_09015 [Anaerolineaceae bacterium]|nr:hypothetical protein [Anaerolineaceae bacterium]